MKKILIIDDNLTVVKNVSKKLSDSTDIPVDTAASFKEAKEILEKSPGEYIMAIAGVVLPDAMNAEAVDYCLELGLPVIVLTASYDEEIREGLISKNVVDYIIERDQGYAEELVVSVRRILRNMHHKVLIVDDSSFHRKFLDRLMKSQQFVVLEAEDGVQGLKVYQENPDINLIIADYDMPKMDGFQLLNEIRAKHGKDEVTIIILSGESNEDIVPKILKHGANDYVKKPFNREEFLCRINMNLDNMEMLHRLKSVAYFDLDTGLFNRSYLYELGHVVHSNAQRNKFNIAVTLVQVDDYEEFSSAYGADFANNVVKIIANVYDQSLKRRSDMIARYSAQLLCVVTEYHDEKELVSFYENIREKVLQRSFKYKSKEIKLSVSMAIGCQMDNSLEKMVNKAMNIMDVVKTKGKGITMTALDAGLKDKD
ncbi:MAG: response regulator [Brevinematales bacterium]|nr:response regulator [Brevinematales bacterium]